MADKLNKTLIDGLEAKPKQYRVWDSDIKGFGLRVSPKGKKTFFVQYTRLDNKKDSFTIGTYGAITLKQAKDIAQDRLAEVRGGKDPKIQRKLAKGYPTISAFMDEFLDRYAKINVKPKTYKGYEGVIRNTIKPNLGNKRIDLLELQDVSQIKNKYANKPYQANQMIAVLSKAYNWAIEESLYKNISNPCQGLSKFGKKHGVKSRERYLTSKELMHLGAVLKRVQERKDLLDPITQKPLKRQYSPALADSVVGALLLFMLTGARRGEILHAQWNYVDFDRGLLKLPDSKTGEKTIRLDPTAIGILKTLYADRNPKENYIIYGKKLNHGMYFGLYKVWQQIRKSAGLDDVRIHDLRHTFASFALENTDNLKSVGGLLGHTQNATTERYTHLLDTSQIELSNATAKKIFGFLDTTNE